MDDDRKVLFIVRVKLTDDESHEVDIIAREEGKTRRRVLRDLVLDGARRELAESIPALS